MKLRIDKMLSNSGVGSRKQIKQAARKGFIEVNGITEKDSSKIIDTENDEIKYNGEIIKYTKFIYLMMNKPDGVVSATEDNYDETVIDLLNDEVDPLKIDDLPKAEERVIDQLLNGDNIWVWTPDNFVSRIQSQYSVFVIAPDESKITTQKIIIEAKAKKKLLIELETHFGISEIQVYPDLAGFARANRSTMPPVTRDANYYIQWGKKYINRKNFETAKDYLGKAISIDKKNSLGRKIIRASTSDMCERRESQGKQVLRSRT